MREIDLHTHTDISDGSETPENTVRHAVSLGLKAIAVTDHDGTGGVFRAQAEGKRLGLEVVAGLELGCGFLKREVHMLGYFVDPSNDRLCETLQRLVDDRDDRNRKMAAAMAADGIRVDLDELKARYPDSVIGRPHMALCLIEAGLAVSVQDAFHRYLDPGRKYYIRRHFLTVPEAAELIRAAGGKPVIAHPAKYRLSEENITELMELSVRSGVAGLECYYSGYSAEECESFRRLAERYGFCATAGSDWHGRHKPHIEMGSGINGELCAPYELLEGLRDHE